MTGVQTCALPILELELFLNFRVREKDFDGHNAIALLVHGRPDHAKATRADLFEQVVLQELTTRYEICGQFESVSLSLGQACVF